MNLPPLPEPADLLQVIWRGDREFARPVGYYYTADQLRAYAAEAVRVALEEAARTCEGADDPDGEDPDCWGWHAKDYAKAIRALKDNPTKPSCCDGGPQWGHAWDCQKCPD